MRVKKKRYHKPGTSPGTLLAPATPPTEKVKVELISYSPEGLEERTLTSIDEALPYRDAKGVTWINVSGLQDVELVQKLGDHFGLHPLALEDVMHTVQRPKLDEYDDQLFIVMTEFHGHERIETEQMALFLGKTYVISFQEAAGDCFDPVRERLRKGSGRLRKLGADYLAYALLDALVDQSFPILEKLGERIEDLEEEVLHDPSHETLHALRNVKRDLLGLRRATWPQREVIHAMQREDCSFIGHETRIYLRDLYDHVIQVMDMIETYRDLTSMLDIYLSSLSIKMNEVMKVLTIIATIFIPLTFVVGLYGMNFNTQVSPWNMPELNWRYGYVGVMGVMLAVAIAMLIYFRRKKWI